MFHTPPNASPLTPATPVTPESPHSPPPIFPAGMPQKESPSSSSSHPYLLNSSLPAFRLSFHTQSKPTASDELCFEPHLNRDSDVISYPTLQEQRLGNPSDSSGHSALLTNRLQAMAKLAYHPQRKTWFTFIGRLSTKQWKTLEDYIFEYMLNARMWPVSVHHHFRELTIDDEVVPETRVLVITSQVFEGAFDSSVIELIRQVTQERHLSIEVYPEDV